MTVRADDLRTDPRAWDRWVEETPTGAYTQLSAWAAAKARNGWRPRREVVEGDAGPLGLQLLVLSRWGLPLRMGYAPRGPIGAIDDAGAVAALTERLREVARKRHLVETVVDPEVEAGHPLVAALREQGWREAPAVQADRTRLLDLTATEEDLWSDVRSKWRQYVNKARRQGVTVEDAGAEALDDFYSVYVETARRAGFVVRARSAYEDVYRAFAAAGRARLLVARLADGSPAATLMLLHCGGKVIEPYGGMTQAGAESRANYLLKWEAIRTSRERGFRTYDMWGLAHPGIEQFKAGFGGREMRYAGAFSLVSMPAVHVALAVARRGQVAVARRRQGLSTGVAEGAEGPERAVVAVAEAADTAPDGWDAAAVDGAGGNVLQGTAWAAHRAADGWTPWFLRLEDGCPALVLTRRQPPLPGVVAYAPRGPISGGDEPARVAARAAGLAAWARDRGAMVLAVDPELPAGAGYEDAVVAAGFHPIEEIQPSRHRLILRWVAGEDADAVFARVAKQTRQRVRAAERGGTVAVEDPEGRHLDAFVGLTDATADRKGFVFESSRVPAWWRAVLAAGQARFWVALHDDAVVGGLLAYRQGGHLATAYSADRADLRRTLPGTMHLLRWTAIRSAIEAGDTEIDLGGVDVRGARSKPAPGDSQYGLYEHKASFGAEWVESASAHEIVLRPWVYRGSLAGRQVRRTLRRLR